MKKFIWILSIISLIGLASCGGGSSKEARELQQKMLNLVGIPQSIVVNICQDENKDGICGVSELQAKISIEKGDSIASIWKRIENTADGKYLLETYDPTLPLLLELKDTDSKHYTDKFTIPFNGLASTENEKDLSILQAMVDAKYLTYNEISAVKEMNNQKIFYEILLKDFEINLKTLADKNILSTRAVLANIKEMAEELKEAGIADKLPKTIDSCENNYSCVEEAMAETLIDENESVEIKIAEKTKITKELLSRKTVYTAYNNYGVNITKKITFNSDATSLTWKQIKGGIESGKMSVRVHGSIVTTTDNDGSEERKIIKVTLKYIETKKNDKIDRLYFTQSDAEEALAGQNGESDSKTPTNNGFTQDMVQNKVVYYHAYTEEGEGNKIKGKGYRKMSFSDTSVHMNDIIIFEDGREEEPDEGAIFDFTIEDGKIKIDLPASKDDDGTEYEKRFIYWILNDKNETTWSIKESFDVGEDGTLEYSQNVTLYFSKPDNFPSEL